MRQLALALTTLLFPALVLANCAGNGDGDGNGNATKGKDGLTPTNTTTGRALATKLPDGKGLSHVHRVNPQLYRGAQPAEEGYKTLKAMGVKTIVNLRNLTSGRKEAEAAGLNYVRIRIHAAIGSTPPTDKQVELFFATVLDEAKQPVYFHCKHGKDRTGTMAALYRIERDGWTPAEAIEEMQAFGYHDIFKDLIQYVRDYKKRGFEPGK